MSKITLNDTAGGYNLQVINDNFQKIEDELNNKVLYRNNPVGEPNSLSTDLDANSKRIFNLPEPTSPSEAARLQDVQNAIAGGAANLIPFTPTGDISSTTVQAAIVEVDTELHTYIGDSQRVDVRTYGAVGDGVTDDTAALQAALNAGWAFLPRGKYRITSELVFTSGSGFIGESSFFWQFNSNGPTVNAASTIFYDGPAGANTCVVRMSRTAVGVLPVFQADESQTLRNACLRNVVIDGNNKAEYGLYSARAGLGNIYDNIVVTGTKKRGFWFGEFWSCRVGSLLAIHNYGSGGSFGEDTFAWGTGNIVNAIHAELLLSFKNGRDMLYRETSAPKEGVGWVLSWNRTCSATKVVCELNYGAGLYVSPRTGPNSIYGLYLEDNCHFDPVNDTASTTGTALANGHTTVPWGMVGYNRESVSGGDSVQMLIHEVFGASPGSPTRFQHIHLTGDTSGGFVVEPSEPWVFRGFYGIRGLTSDFYNFSVEFPQQAMIDSSSTVDIDRCLPAVGASESVVGSVTTLFAGHAATGNRSGRDASNLIAFADALRVARVCYGVVTINVAAMTSTGTAAGFTIDGTGFTRRLTIDGAAAGRFNNNAGTAAIVRNWNSRLRIANMVVLDRMFYTDSRVELDDNPVMRMGTDTTTGAAVNVNNSTVEINGTSVISVSGSGAATKIGLDVRNHGRVSFGSAAAGTIIGHSANNAINFSEAGGTVQINLTTATATWGVSVTYNAGGEGGVIFAPNGIKLSAAGAFL